MNATRLQSLKLHALELCKQSCCNFQHGCLIVRQGRIVASGFNDYKGHAELNAVKNLQRLLYL